MAQDIDRHRLLDDDEIAESLAALAGWERSGDRIRAEFGFPNFVAAFGFMTQVALLAETLNHHPEWSNVYGSVTIEFTNHDAGGITELDLECARRINTFAATA